MNALAALLILHAPLPGDGPVVLDGVTDFVDLGVPDPDVADEGTVMLWFKPEAHQGGLITRSTGGGWGDQRLVLAYNSYSGDPTLIVAIADGEKHQFVKLPLPELGEWSHLAVTFGGRRLTARLNAVEVASATQTLTPNVTDVPVLLGRCSGLGHPFFKGAIDDARIYPRALSGADILATYRSGAVAKGLDMAQFETPKLRVSVDARTGRLSASVDCALMQPLPENAKGRVEVRSARGVEDWPASINPGSSTHVDLLDSPPGELTVTAWVEAGQPYGKPVSATVQWPGRDPAYKGARFLNNLVYELLDAKRPGTRGHSLTAPREGWLFLRVTPGDSLPDRPIVAATVDGREVVFRPVGDSLEAMHHVTSGEHVVACKPGIRPRRLVVRAVGDLVYSMYGSNPMVEETGVYTWEFLREHCLDHYNIVIGAENPGAFDAEINEWTGEGKRWMTQRGLPFVDSAQEAYEFWSGQLGMTDPRMSGIWADEFLSGGRFAEMYDIWCEGLRMVADDPALRGRQFYGYMGSTFSDVVSPMVETIMDSGLRLAPEWYVLEVPTEEGVAGHFGSEFERGNRARWQAASPGAAENRVMILGLFTQPEETCDIYPHCDFNVFLDRQFQFLANDPAFAGLRGLQGYYSPYMGEEQTRLFAALVRHYAIEGRTDRMLAGTYILPHLANPDFTEGADGWDLSPAETGSISAIEAKHFGWLQARYTRSGVGDTALLTRRSGDGPNSFSQIVRDLEPGRPYSLRFYTGNHQDLLAGRSREYEHAVSVTIDDVDIDEAKSFQVKIKSCYSHTTDLFDRTNPYRLNYHQTIFTPRGETARLTFSDWASPTGPADEELIWNFIQVQPYFATGE